MKRIIFHTPITTKRHRELGTCEASDFGKIDLIELDKKDKVLMVSFKDYDRKVEYIEHEGYAYRNLDPSIQYLSQDEEKEWYAKQGKFSPKTATDLMLRLRESMVHSFSHAGEKSFILIGRTLYERYCKTQDLSITTCGNLLFSHWLSVGIERHPGKREYQLSKTQFKRVMADCKKRFEETKPPKGTEANRLSIMSYPTQVKWGEKYNK